MAVNWTTDIYNQAYTRYDRAWASGSNFALYTGALTRMSAHSNFTPSAEILFVGCGFGYWMEYILGINGVIPGNVWGVDNGSHVTANKSNPVYVNKNLNGIDISTKILNLNILAPNILNSLKPYYGGNGRVSGWVVSTLTLTSLQTDQEIADFAAALEVVKGPQAEIAHIFTSELKASTDPEDPHDRSFGMNWQPREYWSSRLPNHWLFDQHYWAYGDNGIWNPNTQVWT